MDQQTRIELSMMVLDLRLASRTPSEHVGTRLHPQRLRDIATVLEHMLDNDIASSTTLKAPPANDTDRVTHVTVGLSQRR